MWQNLKESPGNDVKVVWTCDLKKGALFGKEGPANGSKEEKRNA